MNYTKWACGCPAVAVGAPGSLARSLIELGPCPKCDNDDYWQRQYNEAEPIPVSPERIEEIVEYATREQKGASDDGKP